ncbi:T6SS amidase immunity protein Tai4 family protein [Erwinia sp. E_sp_B04_7]|uniref:T6SS amidase immunity protein Tai4 family protein n=1 Tax=unclassified Erwinia TaxID=2622719 RepID=UPI0030D1E7A0
MKKILLILLGISAASPVFAMTFPAMDSFSQSEVYENWIQNRCTGKISSSKVLQNDAFKSAATWLEVSQLPVGAFNEGDTLIDNALKIKLSGSTGGEFKVLKCSLISQSKEAKEIFNKYSK